MPVNTEHPDYSDHLDQWTRIRDVMRGEDTVKARGEAYLPRLSGQDYSDYEAYKQRAAFFGATSRTVQSMTGLILRREPERTVSSNVETLLTDIGVKGEPIGEIVRTTIEEVLSVGRVGLYVDAPVEDNSNPFISIYFAENIINWREGRVNGQKKLLWTVLREEDDEEDGEDPFVIKKVVRYRHLYLDFEDDTPVYRVQLFQEFEEKDEKGNPMIVIRLVGSYTPRRRGGATFDEIPFTFVNTNGTAAGVEKSPILDLVSVNLAHYRTSADLEHGLHFTALPTAWVAGFDPDTTHLRIGAQTAWVSQDPNASAGFLEFTGSGLGALRQSLIDKRQEMAVLGARLLEEQKREAETAEALRLRQASEASVLSNIAGSVSEAIKSALTWLSMWISQSDSNVSFELNRDYTVTTISPQIIRLLMEALQAGQISWETWFHNLKKGEIMPDDTDSEEERVRAMKQAVERGLITGEEEKEETPDDGATGGDLNENEGEEEGEE